MINPNLEDWWTKRHLTSLQYKHGSFGGAGISVKVILDSIDCPNLNLYSELTGEYDDNLIVFMVDKNNDNVPTKEINIPDESAIIKWYGEPKKINDYKLSDMPKEYFGYTDIDAFFEIEPEDRFKYRAQFHDNFIFNLYPVKEKELNQWTNAILEVHNYYLGTDINWTTLKKDLIQKLIETGDVKIQSFPGERKVDLITKRKNNHWLGRIFKSDIEEKITYRIENNVSELMK
jgi:hypothetical protein